MDGDGDGDSDGNVAFSDLQPTTLRGTLRYTTADNRAWAGTRTHIRTRTVHERGIAT